MTKGEALKMMQAVKAHMTYGIPTWDVTEIGEAFDMAIEALEQPEPQWIPCSERLPSEGENVLLCDTRFGNVAIGKLIRYNTSCCWEVDHWDCDIEDWQAWMPLPEPWRGGEHETD